MFCTVSQSPTGQNFTALSHKSSEHRNVFIIDVSNAVRAEAAMLTPSFVSCMFFQNPTPYINVEKAGTNFARFSVNLLFDNVDKI
jgi:hypothetical protein